MKPAARALFFLCLLSGAWLAEAGRRGQSVAGKGQWGRKGEGRYYDREYHHYDKEYHHRHKHGDYARADSRTHSRGRRRRSDSRSPARSKKSSEKAPEESPGYLEYKRQKVEAAAWQERHMQAQVLALVLEERDKKKQLDQTSADPPVQYPSAAACVVPPLPSKQLPSPDPVCEEKISVAMLKLLEAELGHAVSFGSQPLTASELETQLVAAKAPSKSLNAFIVRHGNGKSPPTRIAAKAKLAAAILKELRF